MKEVLVKNKDIFQVLVDKYSDMVTRICVLRLGNKEDAEDCYQNTFLKLYRSNMVTAPFEDLKRWLIRVAVNECNDSLRRRNRRISEEIDDCIIPVEDSHDKELLDLVFQLPENYRDTIYLYYYEEYPVKDIARILKRREGTVKTQLRRGRELLKSELRGELI